MSIDAYLCELDAALPRLLFARRRVLAEVEAHLRDSAADIGEEEAVARFGPARDLARGYAPHVATQLAALTALALLAFPLLSYPIVENALPPAPWPTERPPEHLHWKKERVGELWLLAIAIAPAALVGLWRGGRLLLLAAAGMVATLVGMAVLGLVLSVQWANAVPGTPGWLLAVPALLLAFVAFALALLARAVALTLATRTSRTSK